MVSGINTLGSIYKQQTINVSSATVESASQSFTQCIQTATSGKSEELWGEFKKAATGMSTCGKCGAMYMGQEPPAVCGKCGNETKNSEDEAPKTEEAAQTNAVTELNNNLTMPLELETSVL